MRHNVVVGAERNADAIEFRYRGDAFLEGRPRIRIGRVGWRAVRLFWWFRPTGLQFI
jgi:hypothetical protein